jgi:cysteine desulfurase/selenocysteine lyase
MFDVHKIRKDFPILSQKIHNKPLIYLDNAATTQKPKCVIDALVEYYSQYNSNIHRGVHTLSQKATEKYEATRDKIKNFINAKNREEIIFTRGTTEAINLVANSYCLDENSDKKLKENDEIIISYLEHHANIVPWQNVCQKTGAKLKVIPINENGEIIFEEYLKLLNKRTKFVALSHISNALGTVTPIKQFIEKAREKNIPVLIDAAQSAQHLSLDVQDLDCDFLAVSGHKLYAPTGIGFLYGKKNLLEKMPPYQTGGDMILSVSFEKTIYNELPYKFEAGTHNIADTIAFGKAIEYIENIGLENIYNYENELLEYGTKILSEINGLKIIGTAKNKASIISFVFDKVHPHDIGTFLDSDGIAVRTGHHCAEPIMKFFGIPATTRASFSFYNTKEEIEKLAEGLKKIVKMFE